MRQKHFTLDPSSHRESALRFVRGVASMLLLMLLLQAGCVFAEEAAPSVSVSQTQHEEIPGMFQRGGNMMWALAALLFIGTLGGVAQIAMLTRRTHAPRDFEKDLVHLADTKGIDAGIALCKEKPSSLARVLHAALVRHGLPLAQLEAAVRNETVLVRYALLRHTRVLGWFAAVTPVIGLLGLVGNLTKHYDFDPAASSDIAFQNLVTGFANGLSCVTFALIVLLLLLGFYFITRALACDLAHDIESKAIEAVVTLDRKARQSIRLIEDIEEQIKTESMIKVPDLSDEFDEQPHTHESAHKTAVTTHTGGAVQE